jgi:acetoin utilization deacetylase AcuC-like enzyme
MNLKAYYSDTFHFPLPPGHRFPAEKYARLRQRLLTSGVMSPADLFVSPRASDQDLLLVHTPAYVDQVKNGTLSQKAVRRMGLPWSAELVERSRRSVGGTIAACHSALTDGLAANLAGGTHHAYPDHGEGFCVFNDVAVSVRLMQREDRAHRILIVDCDVHQGNGTAAIFHSDPTVFTFSVHGAKNFPFHKERSDLDIALDDGATDEAFLGALEAGLGRAFEAIAPDMVIYLAGADPFAGDTLGRLALSKAGLAQRDRMVLGTCRARSLPVAITMSGGYARDIDDTVDIHFETIRTAIRFSELSRFTRPVAGS